MKPTLVILAAGIGSRYGGLKQIDPVGPNGEIILEYSVYDALQAGFGKVVFVIRHDIEAAFREHIGSRLEGRCPCEFAFQELDDLPGGLKPSAGRSKPWGTGHAVLACRNVVREPFAVINADDFYGRGSYQVLAKFLAGLPPRPGPVAEYAMVGFRLRNTLSEHGHVSRGVCEVTPAGQLQRVTERTQIQPDGERIVFVDEAGCRQDLAAEAFVSMNTWGFTPDVFGHLERQFAAFVAANAANPKAEFYLPAGVDQLVQEGRARVSVLPSDERWLGVTYPQDKPIVVAGVRAQLAAGRYPQRLWGN